jgi:colicin import membrane protein
MVNNDTMNWNYTNAAKIALRAAATQAENNARAEAVRQSAEAKAEAKAKKAQEAAKKANNQARRAAVEMSKAEAAAARAARAAARGETSNRRNKTNAANKAKKAVENAKKAQANAEKAEANAKKAKAEALAKNVQNKLVALSQRQNINKNEMAKQGRRIYIQAVKTKLLHPNQGANTAISQQFLSTYDDFKKFVNQN